MQAVEPAALQTRRQRLAVLVGPRAGRLVMAPTARAARPLRAGAPGARGAARAPSRWPRSVSDRQLGAPVAEQLDPVVVEGVVGRRDDRCRHGLGSRPARRAPGSGPRPTSTTSAPSVASPAAKALWRSGPERRVSRPDQERGSAEDPGARPAERQGELGGQFDVGDPSDPVGAEAGLAPRYRLEYCGALRAFFSPYFLLSFSTASRVSRPERLRVVRSSGSSRHRARAIPRRSRAGLARDAAAVDGGVDVVGLGRVGQPQRVGHRHPVVGRGEVLVERPAVDDDGPAPGRKRTRATACLRRPVVWLSGAGMGGPLSVSRGGGRRGSREGGVAGTRAGDRRRRRP